MSHSRLNYLMLLNHHQILIVSLDLNQVGNEYIALCLLKKKVDKQFCVGCKNAFLGFLALYKCILTVLNVSTNADTTAKNAYKVKLA